MAQVASKGLTRAKELYENREQRALELKAQGKKVFGYLCIYPVIEMLTALDIVPYRMFGDTDEPITEADAFLGIAICPFLRSTLDIGIKGRYDFLDGTVFAHICDEGCALYEIWSTAIEKPSYFIDTPTRVLPRSVERHKFLLRNYQERLGEFAGTKITPEKLRQAIELHNQQRALVRALYDLRKPDPPLISGVETLQVLKAVMSLPVEEGNQLLREVITEVKEGREGRPQKKAVRLLIWGPCIDDTSFVEMIESLDANVVMDDTCVGSRQFFTDVELTDDPLDGLAYRYLVELKCARTYREPAFASVERKDHIADLEYRFSYLRDYAKNWNVNGVVLEWMRYCDSHGPEVPCVGDYLDHIGLPHIALQLDYSAASLAPMKTRVQGFIEVIGG